MHIRFVNPAVFFLPLAVTAISMLLAAVFVLFAPPTTVPYVLVYALAVPFVAVSAMAVDIHLYRHGVYTTRVFIGDFRAILLLILPASGFFLGYVVVTSRVHPDFVTAAMLPLITVMILQLAAIIQIRPKSKAG